MVGLSILVIVALPFVFWAYWHLNNIFFQNPRYAAEVFDPILPGSTPLESKRWHGPSDYSWSCTYAIVSLPEVAAQSPPEPPLTGLHWQLRYGGANWVPTPMPTLPDTTRDALAHCAPEWGVDVQRRIKNAVSSAGSFFIVGSVGETVFVYSKSLGIAARVRFGD